MPPKVRTVADAVEYIEDVARTMSRDLNDHKAEVFKDLSEHKAEQREYNQDFGKRIVELEKSDIRAQGKLDAILDRLDRKQTTWQVWGPALLGSAISIVAVIVTIVIAFGGKQ